MRFLGGGIGHRSTNSFTELFGADSRNAALSSDALDNDDWMDEDDDVDAEDDIRVAEELENGYLIDDEDEPEIGDDDEDETLLGPEDGEEPWGIDDLEAEGMAEF